ncbi:acyltransferase family protein [Phytohabitans suffuscus]|uniref:Integral membrane transferase n=1 Tax=Phytohabitans suffuscus TaxID=624315 RepID=A0A6F8YGZ2_9ACTN|nr:acyltransferase [Phytohabitans suffuscus]BCB85350.1 integral membrane transferase [Phytohabitans suffuscus]
MRDRYLDSLRAAAIVRVIVYHAFPVAWLGYAFPAMGVMFGIGGSLMAHSLDRSNGAPDRVLASRLRRLLPAFWALGAVVVPAMLWAGWPDRPHWPKLLLWLAPVAQPPGNAWAVPATEVLWYIVTYLWFVLLSPILLWVYRRWPLRTVLVPLALVLMVGDSGVVSDLATFGACWIVGFAHRDGALRRMATPLLAALAAGCVAAGVAWVVLLSPGSYDLNEIPPAQALYSLGFVLVLLRVSPRLTWRPFVRVVSAVNSRAVTIYLWHNPAIAMCFVVGDAVGAWRLGGVGYLAVALALLLVPLLALGWIEDVAARRRPRLLPWDGGGRAPAKQPQNVSGG